MLEQLEYNKYNKKAKFYELIDKEVIDTHVKEILDEILNKYDNIVLKGSYDIENCKLVKHNIWLNDKRPIKCKQSSRSTKKNK